MGIFSRFKKKEKFELKKSDFKTEKEEYEAKVTFISDKFAKSLSEFKKKNNIDETKTESKKSTLTTNTAVVSLFENQIQIIYDPTEIEINEDKFIEKINQKLNWISENEDEINSGIVKNLLSVKNESWLEENESELTEKDFIQKIKLNSILFFGDASCEMNFDDGNLFWEHQIIVNLSVTNKLKNADIQG